MKTELRVRSLLARLDHFQFHVKPVLRPDLGLGFRQKQKGANAPVPTVDQLVFYTERLAPLRFKSPPTTRKFNLDDALVVTCCSVSDQAYCGLSCPDMLR